MSARQIASGNLVHGSKVVGGTAVQLTSTPTPLNRGVTIRADDGNSTGFIYVGASNAVTAGIASGATDGYKLKVSESVTINIDDLSKIWLIGSTSNLAVSFQGN